MENKLKDSLINKDLYLENINDYKDVDLKHVNKSNIVGIVSKVVNGKREYTIYENDEYRSVKLVLVTTNFEEAIKKARNNFRYKMVQNESSINNDIKIQNLNNQGMLLKIGKKNEFMHKYNIDSKNIETYDNFYLAKTATENLYIMLDKEWNIIDVKKYYPVTKEAMSERFYKEYCNGLFQKKFSFPFNDFSLKNFIDISYLLKKLDVDLKYFLDVSGQSNIDNKTFISLLAYIKFMGLEIEKYFYLSYSLKSKGFEEKVPSIYEYIEAIFNVIDNTVDESILKRIVPNSKMLLDCLGEPNTENSYLLNFVIDLMLRQKGYEIIHKGILNDYNYTLEKIDDDSIPDVYDISIKTLNIFDFYGKMHTNDLNSFLNICEKVLKGIEITESDLEVPTLERRK